MFQNPVEYIRAELIQKYTPGEIRIFTSLILKEVCNLSFSDIVACKFSDLSDNEKQKITHIVNRLNDNEPIQYVLGESEFYGLNFKLNSSVLIPRPETEELVEWILLETKKATPHILDIGTGSGCIPIALAKHLHDATIEAWDVSDKALDMAKENALINNVSVQFQHVDVLKHQDYNKKYDVIVSNPPYITESEKDIMDKNVLDFEPNVALFVPNEDALIFYHRIAAIAKEQLNHEGMLYFEINQSKGPEVQQLLKDKGFVNVELKKDMSGNYRMIRAMNIH